ncbi:MAG: formylglycine-generating enzyme family protein [Planctomyces sp.]
MRLLSIRADAGKSGQSEQGGRARVLAGVLTLAAMGVFVVGGVGGVSTALAQLPPAPAGVEVTTIHGIEFSTIGNPGNAAIRPEDHQSNPYFIGADPTLGAQGTVNETYRIARTETTIGQWLGFVNAFAPHWEGAPDDVRMTGRGLDITPDGRYTADPRRINEPIQMISWLTAAAYCNWLCNDQRTDADAFRTGAYDLRGINLAQPAPRSTAVPVTMNAAFRLPTLAEWNKAAYFDPNRYGESQPGWWLFPNAKDRPPISGSPETGGETNAGAPWAAVEFYPVAEYANSQSAYGLFDVSGGVREMLTDYAGTDSWNNTYYYTVGSNRFSGADWLVVHDHFGNEIGGLEYRQGSAYAGFRIVATIPSPPVIIMACFGLFSCASSRSRGLQGRGGAR